MLTGSELFAKVEQMGDAGQSDTVHACGDVSTKKERGERLNFTAFYEALLAKGVELGASPKIGRAGRKRSYLATKQGNGNLLFGEAHTARLDLAPGEELVIKLGRKQIRLIPAGASEDEQE
jgi:hypothetical protein